MLHDGQQRKIGALIVLHDVTRLRHLEKIRRDFVANVSHELKTPITSIKGFVETLLHEQLEDKDNSLRFLGIILRQVNRLDAIIGDLLMLSRLERGSEEQTIQLQCESLAEVLRAAVEMCEKKAADKSMRLDLECPADLQADINAPLLEQAVTNLIDNAIKYSEAGAAVRIAASHEGNAAVIRVAGSGLRHRGRPSAALVRAVLPRGPGAQPGTGRHRLGTGHRQTHRGRPPRLGPRREHRRPGQHVLHLPPAGTAANCPAVGRIA